MRRRRRPEGGRPAADRRRAARAAGGLLALALLAAVPAAAQTPFALVNIGADVMSTDARMVGRGGWGLADGDTLIPAFKNPAGLVPLRTVVLLVNGYGETRRSREAADERTTRRVLLPDLRAAIPLLDGRLALSAGVRTLRSTTYETSRPLLRGAAGDTALLYTEQFVRDGSQFDLPLAVSLGLNRWLAVSAEVDVVRGSIREILEDDFQVPGDYRTAARTQRDDLSGTAARFGILLSPHPRLRLGATYRSAHDLTVERRVSVTSVAAKADTTFRLRIPERWQAGMMVGLGRRWQVGADYSLQPWTKFEGRSDWRERMRDEWTLACGLERRSARREDGGWSNVPLRLGFRLRRWGYTVGGEEIRERTFTVGSGFAFRGGRGHLDFALGRGWVGDLADNGAEDSYWRLTVSVVGLEKWW